MGAGGEREIDELGAKAARATEVLGNERSRPVEHGGSAGSGGGGIAEAAADPDAPRAVRGPDREQRIRRTFRDEGAGPDNIHDWTDFDIGRVVRIFRTSRTSAIRFSLRKLHVRRWHASEHTMCRFLERVGVSEAVLKLIPEVCQTCNVCRTWAKPGPSNACSVSLTDAFNQQVECDLLFVHKHIVFHMLDRCTRWHAPLMKAIDTM